MNVAELSAVLRNIASILEIRDENVFRIRAYEKAAENIERFPNTLETLIKEDKLSEIPGIGKDLSSKIKEFYATGKIKAYEDLKKTTPPGLLELLNIPSVGPKTAKLLFEKLKINNLSSLEKAITRNKLKNLPGIKEKTIQNIAKGIEIVKRGRKRMTLQQAMELSDTFLSSMSKTPGVSDIETAGSLRRKAETVGDIDILIISKEPEKIMNTFVKLPEVKTILAKGETKSSIRTKNDIQVDCRVLEQKSFGAALLYFTGSKDFNIKLRQLAIKKGLKINEYGVFKENKFICGRTEEEIFKALGMSFVVPELRENKGEIELALKGKLPELIGLKDIKGDLHVHSEWSDGLNSISEMVQSAKALGYSYIAVTDHSESLKVAGGLNVKRLIEKKREIDRINSHMSNFRVLLGTEAEIDSDGNIDYNDKVLKEIDMVVAAIHSGFKQGKSKLSKRIIKACSNKYVHIIAHPTGRLWGARDAYELDFKEIFKAAHDTNTALEINSYPERLDLNDNNARAAVEAKVKLAVNTDAHKAEQLKSIQFGLAVARRAWVAKDNVINTLTLDNLLKNIKK
ncbi:MAG: DNA polymerase/3'-5' exonuclease PolX [Candidatus Omnitrophota bacterium]|jgi:DNA polymerase (family 10)